jgi:hypothetical protein
MRTRAKVMPTAPDDAALQAWLAETARLPPDVEAFYAEVQREGDAAVRALQERLGPEPDLVAVLIALVRARLEAPGTREKE